MRVAADNCHARFGNAEFRADHVHDALFARTDVIELNAEIGAVFAQRVDLLSGDLIDNVEPAFDGCGHIVIDRGNRAIGAAHFAACKPQSLKRLRRRHLVDQLKVDVEQRGLALGLNHYVLLPDLLE